MDEMPREFTGTVVITWPQSRNGAVAGANITVSDGESGKAVTTVTALRLHATTTGPVWAEVTMFAAEDGTPILKGKPYVRDGEPVLRTFPFLVAEMRVAGGG